MYYRGDRITILLRERDASGDDLPPIYFVRLRRNDSCLSKRRYVCHSRLFRSFERYGMTAESEEILEEPEEYGCVQ
jgi:hypothetical protein